MHIGQVLHNLQSKAQFEVTTQHKKIVSRETDHCFKSLCAQAGEFLLNHCFFVSRYNCASMQWDKESDCKLKHAARSLAFKEAAVLVGEERSEFLPEGREDACFGSSL